MLSVAQSAERCQVWPHLMRGRVPYDRAQFKACFSMHTQVTPIFFFRFPLLQTPRLNQDFINTFIQQESKVVPQTNAVALTPQANYTD
jgi:hypothetical protein